MLTEAFSLFADFHRPIGRNAVCVDSNFGCYSPFTWRPENIDDLSCRLLDMRRKVENSSNDNLTMLCVTGRSFRNQNSMGEFGVVRNDHANASLANELPGNLMNTSVKYFDELAFRPAPPVLANNPDGNPIAVKQRPHFSRRQVNVIAAFVQPDKTETILVAADGSCDQVQPLNEAKLAATIGDDLSRGNHRT